MWAANSRPIEVSTATPNFRYSQWEHARRVGRMLHETAPLPAPVIRHFDWRFTGLVRIGWDATDLLKNLRTDAHLNFIGDSRLQAEFPDVRFRHDTVDVAQLNATYKAVAGPVHDILSSMQRLPQTDAVLLKAALPALEHVRTFLEGPDGAEQLTAIVTERDRQHEAREKLYRDKLRGGQSQLHVTQISELTLLKRAADNSRQAGALATFLAADIATFGATVHEPFRSERRHQIRPPNQHKGEMFEILSFNLQLLVQVDN